VLEPDAVGRLFGQHAGCAWAVHPEAFDLLPAQRGAGGDGLWVEAAVTDLRVHGPVLRYLVLACGTELKVDTLNRSSVPTLRRGERVWLHLDRSQVREVA
jgi:TOBE domain